MAYPQGAIVISDNPFAPGYRPFLIVSNPSRPYHGDEYTTAIVTTTDREQAVRFEAANLTDGAIDVYPSFVNPWSLHVLAHDAIDRGVAQVSDDVIRAVADGITRYVELAGDR
jgi:mRNA-degrading endonuclease toxin of MazEF toxin-antitoxin module